MSSRHLVDPQLIPLIELIPSFDLNPDSLAQNRAMMEAMSRANPVPTPEGVTVSERMIPGRGGAPDVRVVISAPTAKGEGRPGILHIHGGGYVMGSPDGSAATTGIYAAALGAVVVSVDYRLAPETPYPGALEDGYAALTWLHREADALGVDRDRIAVTGESAGGGLAAAVVLFARDHGEVPVAFQHLIFPMLDDRTAAEGPASPHLGEFVWTHAANVFGWTSLLGAPPGGEGVSPYAAPARAENLAGLPPTFIITGALDLFLHEDVDYARRLILAGVPTELHVYPGAPHGFMLIQNADVSQAFARDSLAAFRKALRV